jgi:hypothetical protein
MCDQQCPSNLGTTITDLVPALWDDIVLVGRLIAQCFGGSGIAGCICQFVTMLEPHWRKIADPTTEAGKKIRCANQDPWEMIRVFLDTTIIDFAEDAVNTAVRLVNTIPLVNLAEVCLPNPHFPDKCPKDHLNADHFRDCENSVSRGGMDMMVRAASRPMPWPRPYNLPTLTSVTFPDHRSATTPGYVLAHTLSPSLLHNPIHMHISNWYLIYMDPASLTPFLALSGARHLHQPEVPGRILQPF